MACNGQKNVFCEAQLNPIAHNLINLYPLPNTNNGKTYANYVVNTPATYDFWQWGSRVDWNISGKDQAFARFSYLHIPQNYSAPLGANCALNPLASVMPFAEKSPGWHTFGLGKFEVN